MSANGNRPEENALPNEGLAAGLRIDILTGLAYCCSANCGDLAVWCEAPLADVEEQCRRLLALRWIERVDAWSPRGLEGEHYRPTPPAVQTCLALAYAVESGGGADEGKHEGENLR